MLRDEKSTYSMTTFLAFIILGNDGIFGTFNLKSHVITAGPLNLMVSKPVSTSLVTYISSFLISILEANVACGQFKSPARIWPV